ncbi:lysR family transcriptional regulator [Streptomyces laurentii]|jgi:hypothetical protein|uniref:LysR family transcriptional regulator n=1 Tax=Streptomyces laurentii TaxID=39478 RepID=A0A169NRR3_STRLU|nr:lysR family transcriptional regulator [Streptomyces laurentii]
MAKEGLRVTVQGDLPADTMERIAAAVRRTVLDEVAELDIAPPLREVAPAERTAKPGQPDAALPRPPIMGIIFEPEE